MQTTIEAPARKMAREPGSYTDAPSLPVDLPERHRASDDRLRLLIERIERMEEEKKGVSDDIRDTYAEAKAVGYDVKVMRQVVKLRKMNPDERAEMQMVMDTYCAALGIA
jgi:uncharacterized protein (UPF0335 family)